MKDSIFIFLFLSFSQFLYSAEERESYKGQAQFFGFRTIDPQILRHAIDSVPEQSQLWSCGLHQCGHVIKCVEKIDDTTKDMACVIDYESAGDYPLSVNVNMELLHGVLGSLKDYLETDSGFFRVGATPHEIADFINAHLPPSYPYKAKAISVPSLTVETLIETVQSNIDKNLPTITYYVADPKMMFMHIVSVVGYLQEEQKTTFIILDSSDSYEGSRFYKEDAQKFITMMNASQIIGMVTMIDMLGSLIGLRGAIQAQNGRVVEKSILNKWKGYSFIRFIHAEERESCNLLKDKTQDCSIQ